MPNADEVRDQQRAAWAGLSAGWEKWDEIILDQLGPVTTAMVGHLAIAETHRHLDIASGTGEPGLTIARLAPNGSVVLTDLAPEMVQIAERRAAALGVTNVESRVCSADDLPFDDASFDGVSVRFGYMFLPDLEAATAEFVRVLRPGGRLCASVWVRPEENPWTSIAMEAIATEVVVAPPDPDGPSMFRVRGPRSGQLAVRGGRSHGRRGVGRPGHARDRVTGAVLGDDQRARLARRGSPGTGRRTCSGADPGRGHLQGERLRRERRGPGPGSGALHRGNQTSGRWSAVGLAAAGGEHQPADELGDDASVVGVGDAGVDQGGVERGEQLAVGRRPARRGWRRRRRRAARAGPTISSCSGWWA